MNPTTIAGLPPTFQWIEADYPKIIEYKNQKLAGEKPKCVLTRAGVDQIRHGMARNWSSGSRRVPSLRSTRSRS